MRFAAILLLMLSALTTKADQLPVVAVILDDMGNDLHSGRQALALPAGVTYAILPHSPHARTLADEARQAGRELMLHLPMQARDGRQLGPGGLELHMTRQQFRRTLRSSLASVPNVAGINNHMGSQLTRHPGAMQWLMQAIREQGDLYYVDSRTDERTVAEAVAKAEGLPSSRRDVFLDNVRDEAAIRAQFDRLLVKARRHGSAIAIGHPYPETLAVLAHELSRLDELGVELLPVSAIIEQQQRIETWRASSSPSQKVAKNSKQLP